MRQGEKFSDARVKGIKEALVRGVSANVIARVENVSPGTIWRIKWGQSYRHVKVLGEEALRPPVEVVEYTPEGEQVAEKTALYQVGGITQKEADDILKDVMAHQAKAKRKEEDMPQEILDMARRFGAFGKT